MGKGRRCAALESGQIKPRQRQRQEGGRERRGQGARRRLRAAQMIGDERPQGAQSGAQRWTIAAGGDVDSAGPEFFQNIARQESLSARAGQRQRAHQAGERVGDASVTGGFSAKGGVPCPKNQRRHLKQA